MAISYLWEEDRGRARARKDKGRVPPIILSLVELEAHACLARHAVRIAS